MARLCNALQSLLLRLLNTCAFAIVLVDAFDVVIVLTLVVVDALDVALVGDCGVRIISSERFAWIVKIDMQWQYLGWRLVPLDRLDTDFTQSLSVRKVCVRRR